MKKVVLTYGTFDLFHIGHVRLLERARALGDFLVVGVSTDEFNALKGKKSVIPFEHRSEIVRAVRYVDLVIPESNWEQKVEDIRGHAVHTFVMGDDWTGKFDHLEEQGVRVVYLPRTLDISSTQINAELPEDQRDHLNQVSDENLTLPQ